MSENLNDYLSTARDFLIVGEKRNAYTHYAKVSLDSDQQNAEAEVFASYLAYLNLLEEHDGASAVNAFKSMTTHLKDAVQDIKESELGDAGKRMVIKELVEAYTPITRFLFTKRISTTSSTIETGVLGLYGLGNAIESEFDSDVEMMKVAAVAWKEAVSLQRQFYAYKYNGVTPEEYVAKIQKIEPTYTMPKKAGCISIGDK